MAARRRAGFTLVELSVTLAVAAGLLTIAWPSLREPLLRSRRADAVAALTRIQLAQEQYRALHGRYAERLDSLRGAAGPRSAEGLYELELQAAGGQRYEALARPRAGSAVDGDARCPVLRLQVDDGRASLAPNARCWNR
jgi:type IV pilus assembly protein PilE